METERRVSTLAAASHPNFLLLPETMIRLLALPLVAALPTPRAFAAQQGGGKDFLAEAELLYRVVACEGEHREQWVGRAQDLIARLCSAGWPSVVVYHSGGGDLISALTTCPDATDITTMSLEFPGDPPRRLGETRR